MCAYMLSLIIYLDSILCTMSGSFPLYNGYIPLPPDKSPLIIPISCVVSYTVPFSYEAHLNGDGSYTISKSGS